VSFGVLRLQLDAVLGRLILGQNGERPRDQRRDENETAASPPSTQAPRV
jgi:hypothetical protein